MVPTKSATDTIILAANTLTPVNIALIPIVNSIPKN